jgi:hypothetical protein
MTNRTIYTRAYSKSSAGQFVSAKGMKMKSYPLSQADLLDEFRLHASISNREPTALVSVSDRIVDTVKRAFDKHYEDDESAADIWFAFIEVPPNEKAIHSVKELAEKCGLKEPNRFNHEFIFEWAIPEHYVLHKVSLQTLMKREIQQHWFSEPSTMEVRCRIAKEFRDDISHPWEIGFGLGFFARCFGARAPLNWIPYQLLYDCVEKRIVADDLEDGINTILYEWWLSDTEFLLYYNDFKEYRDMEEERIAWDLIDFWETWHDLETLGEMSTLLYKEKRDQLLAKHKGIRADVEAEALRLGL